MMGGQVGKDIYVFRDLLQNPTEERLDAEAKHILDFQRKMIKKYEK